MARVKAEEKGNEQRQRLRQVVDEAKQEGFPESPEEREGYFMECVGEGEQLAQQGTYMYSMDRCSQGKEKKSGIHR